MATRQSNPQIKPQPRQEAFLACPADIVIFGGAAYGGKTYALLMESTRNVGNPRYNGVIFRRDTTQITAGGGIWDTASTIYPLLGGLPQEHKLTYKFPSGSYIKFSHLQYEDDKFKHQGAQYVYLAFDELEHFTEGQFFYLLSRNRPPSGYSGKCYCRAATNPNADSWLRKFLDWWIDSDTGYAIPERSGVLRYFVRRDDAIVWVDAGWRDSEGNAPKSVTFIPSYIDDNPAGLVADATYKSNLLAQDSVQRERLLSGNWNITYGGGMINPLWFKRVGVLPSGGRYLRYWDRASTIPKSESDDPDWTVGALIYEKDGELYIVDIVRFRGTSLDNERRIRGCAELDGVGVPVALEQEPGSSGVDVVSHYQREVLMGYEVHVDRPSGKKEERCRPWVSLCEQGHVYMLDGGWNREFLAECGSFPFGKKDQVDAVSGGYKMLMGVRRVLYGYVSAEWGNRRVYGGSGERYGVLVGGDGGGISGTVYMWDGERLYVEMGVTYEEPDGEGLRGVFGGLRRIWGSGEMFGGGNDSRKVLRKWGLRVRRATSYEEGGCILDANRLFGEGVILVNPEAVGVDIEYRTWKIENDKPIKGFGLCKGLLIMITQLREMGEFKKKEEVRSYSKAKREIREKVRGGEVIDRGKGYDWLEL